MKVIYSLLLAAVFVLGVPAVGRASLIMEPVFSVVPGTGGSPTILPIPLPGAINGATGLPFITADEPGEIVTYPAGFPADDDLVNTIRFFNDTLVHINSFSLSIVGLADEPVPFTFTITRGPVDHFLIAIAAARFCRAPAFAGSSAIARSNARLPLPIGSAPSRRHRGCYARVNDRVAR